MPLRNKPKGERGTLEVHAELTKEEWDGIAAGNSELKKEDLKKTKAATKAAPKAVTTKTKAAAAAKARTASKSKTSTPWLSGRQPCEASAM